MALSGGKSENTDPVPPEVLSTQPRNVFSGIPSSVITGGVASLDALHLVLAEIGHDPNVVEVEGDDAQERLLRRQRLAELDGSPADDPPLRCPDQAVAQVELRGAERRLALIDPTLERLELCRGDVRLQLGRLGLDHRGVGAAQGLAALLEPDAGLLELKFAGEYLALAGGDVAAQRLELGRRLAISRRAVVPILHRDVARGRQAREPLVVQPGIFLERGQSGDLRSLRGEQFLLLPVDLPARLDLHLRRPRCPLGLAPPCTRTVQKGAPILANQPHVHGRRAHLGLCVAQVRQHPIDLELERDRIELRQRGSRGDDHVVVRIQRNNLAADIRGNGGDVSDDISVGRPHLEHVPEPPAEHDARRAQQEHQGSGQPKCAAPARRRGRPASRLTPSGAGPGWAGAQRFARSSGHQNGLSSHKSEPESSISKLDRRAAPGNPEWS